MATTNFTTKPLVPSVLLVDLSVPERTFLGCLRPLSAVHVAGTAWSVIVFAWTWTWTLRCSCCGRRQLELASVNRVADPRSLLRLLRNIQLPLRTYFHSLIRDCLICSRGGSSYFSRHSSNPNTARDSTMGDATSAFGVERKMMNAIAVKTFCAIE